MNTAPSKNLNEYRHLYLQSLPTSSSLLVCYLYWRVYEFACASAVSDGGIVDDVIVEF
jgi:hypothetical protein